MVVSDIAIENSGKSYILVFEVGIMTMPKHIPALKKEQSKRYSAHWQQSLFIGAWGTQKTYSLGNNKVYVVQVQLEATKIAIKKAFEAMFNIKPLSVNTVTWPGKHKTKRTKTAHGQKAVKMFTGKIKKAMIALPADAKFDFAQA